jgi:hypothetical protein
MRRQQGVEPHCGSVRNVAVAATRHRSDPTLLAVTGCLVAAIIALWIAYLPSATGSVLTKLNVLPQHLSADSYTINHLNKGGRLAGVRFDDRWSAIEPTNPSRPATQRTGHIPDGCEAAFSRLVKVGNFSTRCVAAVSAPTRLALVE